MTPLVQAQDLRVAFGGRGVVLDGVSLDLRRGEQLALVGRSGSGKSTLLLALAGLLAPDAGSVRWPGLPADPGARRAQLAMVFQAPSLVPELTADQNVALPLRLRGQEREAAYSAARRALEDLGLGTAGAALPDELSGGQQQRVALARVLAGRPAVVLADEPTGALDDATARHVLQVLQAHVRSVGGALLVATHDTQLANTMAGAVELRDGRLAGSGDPVPVVDAGPVERVRA